jgi:hypothetical protein
MNFPILPESVRPCTAITCRWSAYLLSAQIGIRSRYGLPKQLRSQGGRAVQSIALVLTDLGVCTTDGADCPKDGPGLGSAINAVVRPPQGNQASTVWQLSRVAQCRGIRFNDL